MVAATKRKTEFQFEHDGVTFVVKAVNRCYSSIWGYSTHHPDSDSPEFWVHQEDRRANYSINVDSAFGTLTRPVRVFACVCKKCPHPLPDWEHLHTDAINHREITYFLKYRQSRIERRIEVGVERSRRAAEVEALALCERIADEGYTEEVVYAIKELVMGLRANV